MKQTEKPRRFSVKQPQQFVPVSIKKIKIGSMRSDT